MKRLKACVIIGCAYLLACILFIVIFNESGNNTDLKSVLRAVFAADVGATAVIWMFGLAFKNSSFYDPYWSFFPWFITLFLMNRFNAFGPANLVFFAALSVWSWRLTANWAYTCTDIHTEDWRYARFKNQYSGAQWHIINFFGINMMPTIIVFLAFVPAIVYIGQNRSLSGAGIIGALVILAGTALEFFADMQMHRFKKNNPGNLSILNSGLWKYCRHPNYLGEILVWLGVYLTLALSSPAYKLNIAGFAIMTGLFVFISIPLMEKRQLQKKPDYRFYMEKTSMLLLWPQKKGAPDKSKKDSTIE